jgi:hypothetical protein
MRDTSDDPEEICLPSGLRALATNGSSRFVTAIILVNAPFWLLATQFFLGRAFLNLDLGIAICLLPRHPAGGFALLALGWGIDWLSSQSMTFHFGSPLEFIHSLQFASALRLREFASWSTPLLFAPFLVCCVLAASVVRGQRKLWRPAVVFTALMVGIDALNGSSMLSRHDDLRVGMNIAGSPWTALALSGLTSEPAGTPLSALPPDESAQGLVDIPGWAQLHPEGGVLFVVVESMGSPDVPEIRRWLSGQLVDEHIRTRYLVREADLPFRGSTTAGELRSMCALGGSYRRLDASSGSRCLPAKLKELGWATVGMHGFSGRVFSREVWWPLIGLQSIYFIDAPEFGDLRCGEVFRGVCDNRLVDIGIEALKPGRRFVYLLTVNTHLPLASAGVDGDLGAMCERHGQSREACHMFSRLGGVLRHIRNALATQNEAPLVVVVGDHAPPFNSLESRRSFSEDKVPAFVLLPRD